MCQLIYRCFEVIRVCIINRYIYIMNIYYTILVRLTFLSFLFASVDLTVGIRPRVKQAERAKKEAAIKAEKEREERKRREEESREERRKKEIIRKKEEEIRRQARIEEERLEEERRKEKAELKRIQAEKRAAREAGMNITSLHHYDIVYNNLITCTTLHLMYIISLNLM